MGKQLCFSLPSLLQALLLVFFTVSITETEAAVGWRRWTTPSSTGNNSTTLPNFGESKKFEGSSDFVHLRYHMGPVLTANVTVHPIWYGAWAVQQKRIIRSFLRSIDSPTVQFPSISAWWKTVRLYTDQTGANITAHITLGQEKNDRKYSHGKLLSRLDIQRVIRAAVTATTRPLPVNPRGGLYLVLTSSEVAVDDFCNNVCGFHYFTFPSIVGFTIPYAWVGNSATQCPGICAYPFALPPYAPAGIKTEKPPNGDVGVDGMVSVVAHELAEISSNPLVNAWYAGSDPVFPTEIADLCEGIYGTGGGGSYTGQLTVDSGDGAAYNLHGVGGRRFLVQWVWNPLLSYCFGPNALDQ